MQALTSLTVVRDLAFTGCGFSSQPGVTDLTLVSCLGITDDGIRNIVDSCPELQTIAFCAEDAAPHLGQPAPSVQTLSTQGLVALSQASRLTTIDLRGVSAVSRQKLQAMQECFHAQQSMRQAQPEVSVLLSKAKSCQAEATVTVLDALYFPSLLISPDAPARVQVFKPRRVDVIRRDMTAALAAKIASAITITVLMAKALSCGPLAADIAHW